MRVAKICWKTKVMQLYCQFWDMPLPDPPPLPEQAEGGRGVQRGSFPGKFQSFTVSVVLNWSKGYKARLRVWMQLWNIMLS